MRLKSQLFFIIRIGGSINYIFIVVDKYDQSMSDQEYTLSNRSFNMSL